jgi:peptidoglycan/LPS O-acetylase OafA/YrhL
VTGGEQQREQFAALTTLRFVAAAMIVVYHTYLPFGVGRALAETVTLQQAVSFFFVLSGFVLAYVHPSLGAHERPRFLLARFARIWPLHAATLLAVVLFFPAGERTPPGVDPRLAAVANLSLLQAWSSRPELNFSYNGPSWTLSTEAAFYLAFPLLVRNLQRTWPWKLALALACAAGVITYANHRDLNEVYVMVYIHPLARMFEFTLGMTMVLAWQRVSAREPPGRGAGTAIEIAALAFVVWAMIQSIDWAQRAQAWPLVGGGGALWLVNAGIPGVAFGPFVVVIALGWGHVSRVLSARPLVRLGEISFAVYLIHHLLVRAYVLHRPALAVVPAPVAYVLFWVALLVLAFASWTWLERPARRLLRSLGQRADK